MRRPDPRRIKASGATRLAEAQAQLERPALPPPAFRTLRHGQPDEKGRLPPTLALSTPIQAGLRVEADSGAAYYVGETGALVRKDKIRGLRKKDRRKIRAKRRAEIEGTEERIRELQGELAAIEAEMQAGPAGAEAGS